MRTTKNDRDKSTVKVLRCRAAEEEQGVENRSVPVPVWWETERVGPFTLQGGHTDMHSFRWEELGKAVQVEHIRLTLG